MGAESQYDRFILKGGLDTNTPYLDRAAGSLYACQNFDADTDGGGYRFMPGYERYDGRPKPSESNYYTATCQLVSTTPPNVPYAAAFIGVMIPGTMGVGGPEICRIRITSYVGDVPFVLPAFPVVTVRIDILSTPIDLAAVGNAVFIHNGLRISLTNITIGPVPTFQDSVPAYTGAWMAFRYIIGDGTVPLATYYLGNDTGLTVTGQSSGTTATIARSRDQNRLIFDLILKDVDGAFDPTENLILDISGGATIFKPSGFVGRYNPSFLEPLEDYLNDMTTPQGHEFTATEYRRMIIKPPAAFMAGTFETARPIMAVWEYTGNRYAFARDVLTSLKTEVWRDSKDGWVLVSGVMQTIAWQAATSPTIMPTPGVGKIYKQGTGGIEYIVPGNIQGNFGFAKNGGFTNGVPNGAQAWAPGDTVVWHNGVSEQVLGIFQATLTFDLPADSLFRFINHNFTGVPGDEVMIFTTGQSPAMMYDGVEFGFIFTGTPWVEGQWPTDVVAHYEHLFLGYAAGRLEFSQVGDPLQFNGDLGAGEIVLGSKLRDLIPNPQALVIGCEDNIQALTGQGYDSWQKDLVTRHDGIAFQSGSYITQSFTIGRAGIVAVDRTSNYGNFIDATVSDMIRDLIVPRFDMVTTAIGGKRRSQYRVFYSDGYSLIMSMYRGEIVGIGASRTAKAVVGAWNPYGDIYFVMKDDTFAYQMDSGYGNDGLIRETFLRTSYANQGDPDTRKAYRRMAMSVRGLQIRPVQVGFTFSKGDTATPVQEVTDTVVTPAGRWGIDNWNVTLFDGEDVPEIRADMEGVGSDVAVGIFIRSRLFKPFVVENLTYEYKVRGKVR